MTPTATEVLRDPCASRWLKDALASALRRDIVDATSDAEVLARVLSNLALAAVSRRKA